MSDVPVPYAVASARVRVRYAETDQMGVVYYANHFVWFEVARNAFTRQQGIDYRQLEAEGCFMPVIEARCRYRSPARYDDEIDIVIQPIQVRRRSVEFGYRILRGDEQLAEGETVQVLVGKDGKPKSWPDDIAAKFQEAAS